MTLTFTEAEIQALIALIELSEPIETPNNNFYDFYPRDIRDASRYFRGLLEDWKPAIESLETKSLVKIRGSSIKLSPDGAAAARDLRKARPPIYYWYEEFYADAPRSHAFASFCDSLYGQALCQDGFSDMDQLIALIEAAGIGAGSRVLDAGCGTGMISEYIRDRAGAAVTGMDYSPRAIAAARERPRTNQEGLSFASGNLDDLAFAPSSFDVIVSIDSLYMPNDLADCLSRMAGILAKGGRIAAFYTHMLDSPEEPRENLKAENTPLGQALRELGFAYRAIDFSRANQSFMRRKRRIADSLRGDFEKEGRTWLYRYLVEQSENGDDSHDPETASSSRYLYLVSP
jgi:ubiquinone/menaquinone biosynthesis C-methylase UbiE